MSKKTHKCEYALYKGEKLLALGTIPEIAESLNLKPQTVKKYKTPSYIKLLKEKSYDVDNSRILIKL